MRGGKKAEAWKVSSFLFLLPKWQSRSEKFAATIFSILSWVQWNGPTPNRKMKKVPANSEWIFLSIFFFFSTTFFRFIFKMKVFLVASDTTLLKLDHNLNWSKCRTQFHHSRVFSFSCALLPFPSFYFQCRLLITALDVGCPSDDECSCPFTVCVCAIHVKISQLRYTTLLSAFWSSQCSSARQ